MPLSTPSPACVIARLALGSLAVIAGCGGTAPPVATQAASVAQASATPSAPPVLAPTPGDTRTPKLRLGHYSSADGTFGLVLDRLASPPRVKVDGTSEVSALAVRRHSTTETTFLTTHDDLALTANDRGQVTAYCDDLAGHPREIALVRDADATPLPEPAAETPDAAAASTSASIRDACGTTLDVHFTSAPPAVQAAGAVATAWRTARAFARVCRDHLGKSAVAAKIHRVRIGEAKETSFELRGGTVEVNGDLAGEARGPFTDEIQHFVESRL